MFSIASFNVNSVRRREEGVIAWLKANDLDVVLLQELKCTNDQFPYDQIRELGYHIEVFGQKSWNGVAIISKHPIENIHCGLPVTTQYPQEDIQSRWIEADIAGARVACLYLPNGNPCPGEKFDYKLAWMNRLYTHISHNLLPLEKPIVLGGDWNICPDDQDCYSPKLFADDALCHPSSRALFRSFEHLGFFDAFRLFHPQKIAWTYWDYQAGAREKNLGLRIDHFLMNAIAIEKLKNIYIDETPRDKPTPSDHTPIICHLALN